MPDDKRVTFLKELASRFTNSQNSNKNHHGNREFQKALDVLLHKDQAYQDAPSLRLLRKHSQAVLHDWLQAVHVQSERSGEKRPIASTGTVDKSKKPKADAGSTKIPSKDSVGAHCDGCGRPGHKKADCQSIFPCPSISLFALYL